MHSHTSGTRLSKSGEPTDTAQPSTPHTLFRHCQLSLPSPVQASGQGVVSTCQSRLLPGKLPVSLCPSCPWPSAGAQALHCVAPPAGASLEWCCALLSQRIRRLAFLTVPPALAFPWSPHRAASAFSPLHLISILCGDKSIFCQYPVSPPTSTHKWSTNVSINYYSYCCLRVITYFHHSFHTY